ncbi:MAG: GNAT family N-acetyltransferase [Nocardioidaceae bacterium]
MQCGDLGSRLQLSLAKAGDAAELLTLQRSCWISEAQANDAFDLPPLIESLADVRGALHKWTTWVLRAEGRLIGSVRARGEGDRWLIGRLMVSLDLQGRGLGRLLLEHAELAAPDEVNGYELFTGSCSADNMRRYRKAGYRPASSSSGPIPNAPPGTIVLVKQRRE